MVIEPGVGKQIDHAAASAGFRITGTEHHPRQTRMHHRAGTHHAGFERDVERATGQAVVRLGGAGRAQRLDLGMGTRIVVTNRPVMSLADDAAVLHHHRPYRYLAQGLGLGSQGQGSTHESLIQRGLRLGWRLRHMHGIGGCGGRYGGHGSEFWQVFFGNPALRIRWLGTCFSQHAADEARRPGGSQECDRQGFAALSGKALPLLRHSMSLRNGRIFIRQPEKQHRIQAVKHSPIQTQLAKPSCRPSVPSVPARSPI